MNARALLLTCVFALRLLTWSPAAGADPDRQDPAVPALPPALRDVRPAPPPDARFFVGTLAGIGTPVGYTGLELGVELTRQWQIALGTGRAEGGFHHSLTTRFRFWSPGAYFAYVGAGGSVGRAVENPAVDHPDGERFEVPRGVYANVELGVGWRTPDGFQLTWVLGVATLLNDTDAACFENCTVTSAGGTALPTPEKPHMIPSLPYLGFSLGFTF